MMKLSQSKSLIKLLAAAAFFVSTLTTYGDDSIQPQRVHPAIRFISPGEAELTWESDLPGSATVAYRTATESAEQTVKPDSAGGTFHQVVLANLQPNQVYQYRITINGDGPPWTSEVFEFDNAMNYTPPMLEKGVDETSSESNALMDSLHHLGGYAVVGESLSEPWATWLAQHTSMTIIAACDDHEQMTQRRHHWYQQGHYGIRFTAQLTAEIPSEIANVAFVKPDDLQRAKELLSPTGTLVCVGKPPATSTLNWKPINDQLFVAHPMSDVTLTRWDHQYGSVSNQSFSGETLDGVDDAGQLEIRWLGRPGADFGIDRNPRMPAPLAVGGRLFHQGMNRMIALDAFNGAVLWSLEMPGLRRVNIPRDCANWCADDAFVYAAAADRLWVIDAATGELKRTLTLPEPDDSNAKKDFDWGYVANTNDTILGTAVTRGSQYEEFWAKPAWYDGKDDQATSKVCGQSLVAYDKQYGNVRWKRDVDAVIHATITIANDRVIFVEITDPELRKLPSGKLTNQQIADKATVVCLDLKTGRELWTQKAPATSSSQVVAFGLADENQFLLESSSDAKFHFTSFDLASGERRWSQSAKWPEDHHGAHMQHAVLMNDKIFVQPQILDSKTGNIIKTNTLGKRRGCATPVGTGNTIIYRGGGGPLSFWSLERDGRSEFTRLRPSCWLSTIPAQGMLFSPEAGGGCSCGGWMECSIGFAPKKGSNHESK
jgi:outer membrane protein assembly factor BamB